VRRRAAGRADGRPWTLPALLPLGLLVGLLVGVAPAAHAAPPGDAAADHRPVQISVEQLEPRTVTPGAPIELSGTLVNDSPDTFTDLSVRLQRGDGLSTREELAAELADPSAATTVSAQFSELSGDLEPGGSKTFTYATTADALQLTQDGVYPLLVNLNGTRDGGTAERIGQVSTHLVVQPATPAGRTTVAWLWPITDRPHRDATGAFTDDDLAGEVAAGGRLDRAVEVLEKLPRVPGAQPEQTDPAVPVTLAVDPALLEELSTMAAGPYSADGKDGAGTADATDLLDRLRRLAAEHPVVALPYADVDADALVAAGQAAVVTRSLPGTAPTAATGTDGDGGTGSGAAIISDALGVQPRTDLGWAAGGTLTPAALDTLQAGGVATVVLSDQGLTDGAVAVGADGAPAAARSTVPTAGGDVVTLVADHRLTALVAAAVPDAGSGRLVEQEYLAELGALTTQLAARSPGEQQTVLVAPPGQVDPDPAVVTAMMADTYGLPWLAAASVGSLTSGPSAEAGGLAAGPADAAGLPAAGLTQIAESSQIRNDFAGAVVGDPDTVLSGYDAAIARAGSAQWRQDPDGFAASAANLRHTLGELRDQVTLLAPVNGTYSLASSDAPLVLTVQNDLPFAVRVRLELRTRGQVGLTTDDIGVTTLQPSSRTPLQVPAHVQQSGGFAVTARLTTPAGGPLGDAVQMQVKSTAYGSITLGITIGAAALLGLLFLRRAVNWVLKRRRGGPDDDAVLDDVSAVPPTRSPV
jgi:hypothetical protein